MRNVEANPGLNPAKMETFQEFYKPTQPDEFSTIYRFVTSVAVEPGETGGFTIRLRGPGVAGDSDELFVPCVFWKKAPETSRSCQDSWISCCRWEFRLASSSSPHSLASLYSLASAWDFCWLNSAWN